MGSEYIVKLSRRRRDMDLNDRLLAVEKQLDRIEKGLQGNKDCLHHIAHKLSRLLSGEWQGEERRRPLQQVRK